MRRLVALVAVPLTATLAMAACSSGAGSSATTAEPVDTVAGTVVDSSAPTTEAPTTTSAPFAASDVTLTSFVSGLTAPVDLAWRTGDDTLYVVQQSGTVVPVRDGVVGAAVLNISDRITYGGEQGLLGLAFHPTAPLAYVNYTDTKGHTNVVEFAVAADGTFDPASARTVIVIEQPFPNHNGGDVVFGPDDMLYIGMGDGGAANDPLRHGQDPGSLLGKILRIDPTPSDGKGYTVPADNPFVDAYGAQPEIWSLGVRNPWRFSFDRDTGDLWIGDVGQDKWEEVDRVAAVADGTGAGRGANFGWSAYEGTHRFNDDQVAADKVDPVIEYPHGDDGCSVSGGTVYRGTAIASLVGWYVYGDFCSGRVWAFRFGTTAQFGATRADGELVELGRVAAVSAVLEGPQGELYALAYNDGALMRIDAA
jgi:glucose/arabinose dehydrogenase